MNTAQIFQLIEQGLTLLPLLIDAGINIEGKIQQMIALAKAGSQGTTISDADLAKIRAEFDQDLANFNDPL